MKLLINPTSYSNAVSLINLGVDQIFIGSKGFSIRNSCELTLVKIKKLVENKKNTEVLILINRFFFEDDLSKLTSYIKSLMKINIDGIIFSDFAINQICYELNYKIKLIYSPNTLVTNYEQFPFYLQNSIEEVSLANELNAKEISEIATNKQKMKIQLQVCGNVLMMESRWKLLSNFQQDKSLKHLPIYAREVSRNEPMIIYEDEYGTSCFTNYSLNLFNELKTFNNLGIDTIRIDSFLHDEQWLNNVVKIYLEALKAIKENKFNESYVKKQLELFPIDKYSKGFYLMDKKDLVYLLEFGGVYE